MDFEPINIYSHRIAPAAVVATLRQHYPEVRVNGTDHDWTELTVVVSKGGLFRRPKLLTLGHDEQYYDGDDWPRQMFGMQNFIAEFPGAGQQPQLMRLIRSFRFCLAVPTDGLNADSKDPRMQALYRVCQALDGVLFTPTSLRDAEGRFLISADGRTDADAVYPRLPPEDDHPDAEPDFRADADDEDEPVPPTAERVVRRLMALAAVAGRATVELDHTQGIEGLEDLPERFTHWINEIGIADELEPQEWKIVQRPVGTLEQSDFINAMWRVEGLAVLAWALDLHPLPDYDELVVPPELYSAIGLLDVEAAADLLAQPVLRPEEELHAMLEHLLALHWRVRDFSIRPQPMDFVAFSRDCWFGSFDLSDFRVLDGDLAIADEPISRADEDDVSRVSSIAMERHLAINWLHGDSEIYSETDTST